MRNIIQNAGAKLIALLTALLSGLYAFAQDQPGYAGSNGSSTSEPLSAGAQGWYYSPTVWIVASLVLIVILVAAARARARRARS